MKMYMIGEPVKFTGSWTDEVYDGIITGWMSQGPFFKISLETAERMVLEQNALNAEQDFTQDALAIIGTYLVQYSPTDGEFYHSQFEDGFVQAPSWVWYIVEDEQVASPATSADILYALGKRGLYATTGIIPEIMISCPGGHLVATREHNVPGWEAAYDTGGDQEPLDPDGPSASASADDVADWLVDHWTKLNYHKNA